MKRWLGVVLVILVAYSLPARAEGDARTWTTQKGKHFEAKYIRDSGPTVFLQTADGHQAVIGFAALSDADQTYVAEQRKAATKVPEVDPFANIAPRTEKPGKGDEAKIPKTFTYEDPQAKSVALAGDFNKWHPEDMQSDGAGLWSSTVNLTPGQHEYKFVVDGEWKFDPNNPEKQKSGKHENSVVEVHAPSGEDSAAAK